MRIPQRLNYIATYKIGLRTADENGQVLPATGLGRKSNTRR